MTKTSIATRLLPVAAVLGVLVASFVFPSHLAFKGVLASCTTGYMGAPTITAVSPNSGPIAGGTSVVITGCGFTGATAVSFGGTAATTFIVNSSTQITATSPAHAIGVVNVTVTTPSGTSATTVADQFTYVSNPCYFNWYDLATPGMVGDNIHLLNTSGTTAHMTVSLPGAATLSATVAPGNETHLSFPSGTIGGPVIVSSDQASFLATQRVQYFQSFNEVKCERASDADTTLYLPWFDRATPGMVGDNIHVLNPSTSTVTVTVAFTGQTPQVFSLTGGSEGHVTFPAGTIGGPIKITATGAVLAAQRVQYYQSFNEETAQSPTIGQTTSYFHWFDKATTGMVGDNIHIVNPGTTAAHVTVALAGQSSIAVTVNGGQGTYVTFVGFVIGGPVKVTSDQPILATQRVQYFKSFNEVPQSSASQAATTLHIMWFDRATPGMVGDNIHILNAGSTTAHVTIALAGAPTQTLTVLAGAESHGTFPSGNIGGPVTITSDQPVLGAQRVQYYQSFNEVSAS